MTPLLYFFLIAGVVLLIPTAYAGKIGAPWVPTRKRALERVFRDLTIGSDDVVVDLGAGDGKVLQVAQAAGATAVGYELSPIMYIAARLRLLGKKNVRVKFANFYKQQLPKDTTIVFTFLLPENMPRLKAYLLKQTLPKLQFVVSYAFPFRDLKPFGTIREENCAPMYIYEAKQITSNT